jgi:heme-degrading monooxygenase HmoA
MIARIWHGRTRSADAEAYGKYIHQVGITGYQATPGNRGTWLLRRIEGDVAHFLTLSFWDSREAIARFAGEDIEKARYYEEDKKYLLEFEPTVTHYDIVDP